MLSYEAKVCAPLLMVPYARQSPLCFPFHILSLCVENSEEFSPISSLRSMVSKNPPPSCGVSVSYYKPIVPLIKN